MDMSELASSMLDWEAKKKELDALEEKIKAGVLELGKTQTVGNVRASYSQGRKSYDYQGAAVRVPYDVVKDFTTTKVDWRQVCKECEIEDVPVSQGQPSVTVKLLKG